MVQKEHVFLEVVRDSIYAPWGIRIAGGADYSTPVTVQRVNVGSPCEGVLRAGDIIVAMAGVETAGMAHGEVSAAISTAGSRLPLVVLRDAASVPAPARSSRASSQPPPMTMSRGHGGRAATPAYGTAPRVGSYAGVPQRRLSTSGDKDEFPIPTNSGLAGMMKRSLERQAPPRRPVGLTSVDLLLRHPRHDILRGPEWHDDVTVYLPRLVPAPKVAPQAHYAGAPGTGPQQHRPQTPPRVLRAGTPDRGVTMGPAAAAAGHELNMRGALTDSVISAGGSASGRSSPQVVFEFHTANKPGAVGVWTPPAHKPTARLVHAQYDTPLGMYTPENVADMIHKQTGTKLRWERKPRVRFIDDIRESDTYRYVNALESGADPRELPVSQRQSAPVVVYENEPEVQPAFVVRGAPAVKAYQKADDRYAQSYTFRRLHERLAHMEHEPPVRQGRESAF